MTSAVSNTRYADLRTTIGGLNALVSYLSGTQVPDHQEGNEYDFNTLDAVVEYNYIKGSFTIKPGLSYRNAVYDDTEYADEVKKTGIFNAKQSMATRSAYLRSEYKFFENKLRLVAGAAISSFSYPKTKYFSYEYAATYKINKKHLLRAVYSKAPRSSALYDTYIDQNISFAPIGYQKTFMMRYEGNKDLQLLTSSMSEIGYRGAISSRLFLDAELFDVHTKNYTLATQNATYVKLNGADTTVIVPLRPTNLPMTGVQQGITLSLNWNAKKLQLKPFITVQKSTVEDYASYGNTPDAQPGILQNDPANYNIYSGIGTEASLQSAPKVFGGVVANYLITPKLNFNVNAYYFSKQTIYHATNIVFHDGVRGIDHIASKLLLNTSVSYEAVKGFHVFVSGKNILNNKSREFFKTDEVPAMFLGGINYEF